jgi:hypothetical protein
VIHNYCGCNSYCSGVRNSSAFSTTTGNPAPRMASDFELKKDQFLEKKAKIVDMVKCLISNHSVTKQQKDEIQELMIDLVCLSREVASLDTSVDPLRWTFQSLNIQTKIELVYQDLDLEHVLQAEINTAHK